MKATWKGFLAAVVQYKFEYPWKRNLIVAQAILESGRGTTILAMNHCNFNGMKYRKSVSQYGGKPFEYFTDSEPRKPDGSQGSDIFFEFDSYEDAIRTWEHRFEICEDGWIAYPKVVEKDPMVMASAEAFLRYVGPIYCPYWKPANHNGLSYADYILKLLLPEAKALLDGLSTSGKVVVIDPGHSERHPGARGLSSAVQEEDLNRYQAEKLAGFLQAAGIIVKIIDPIDDDLYSIGASARGADAFVSLHLNAYNKKNHYTCAMCHSRKQSPGGRSAVVASLWAQEIAEALDMPCFSGSPGWPKGVMAVGLSVLSGAASVACPIYFLSEAFFVDAFSDVTTCKSMIDRAMAAGAKVLAKELLGV